MLCDEAQDVKNPATKRARLRANVACALVRTASSSSLLPTLPVPLSDGGLAELLWESIVGAWPAISKFGLGFLARAVSARE